MLISLMISSYKYACEHAVLIQNSFLLQNNTDGLNLWIHSNYNNSCVL